MPSLNKYLFYMLEIFCRICLENPKSLSYFNRILMAMSISFYMQNNLHFWNLKLFPRVKTNNIFPSKYLIINQNMHNGYLVSIKRSIASMPYPYDAHFLLFLQRSPWRFVALLALDSSGLDKYCLSPSSILELYDRSRIIPF